MLLKGRNGKALIILGAGATRGALSGTFSPRVSPPLNGDYFVVLSKFIRTAEGAKHRKAFERLRKFIEDEVGIKGISSPKEGKKGKHLPTMEEVFNVLFISKDLPEIFHKGRGRKRTKGFRPEVRDFLTLLIKVFRYVQLHSNNRDNIRHYDLLVKAVCPNDVVMTLNYDTLIDNALVAAGWNPKTGYGFPAKVSFEPNTKPKDKDQSTRNILLLKPHGSFNWFAKGSFENLEKALESRPVSEVQIAKLPRAYESRYKRLVRFFIPPLYSKFFRNKFWSKLWVKTYQAARDADYFVIVGCSLIATDYHLRAILSKALTDKKKKYEKIIIVDPNDDVQKTLKKFFRGCSKTIVKYSNFSDFICQECK